MKCFFYDTVDSTNALAWRMVALREAEHGTVIIANQQTAGRGQFGRSWQAAIGGMYLSVVWRLPCVVEHCPLLTMAVAWGLANALQGVGAAVRLKWLNDLILDQRKLGGILTEARTVGDRLDYAVVGVGINWSNPVPAGAIALTEVMTNLSGLHELRAVVLEGLERGYGRLQGGLDGGNGLLQDYQSLLVSRRVSDSDGIELKGVIEHILPTGMAIVRWDGGVVSPHPPSSLRVIYE